MIFDRRYLLIGHRIGHNRSTSKVFNRIHLAEEIDGFLFFFRIAQFGWVNTVHRILVDFRFWKWVAIRIDAFLLGQFVHYFFIDFGVCEIKVDFLTLADLRV